MNRPPLFVNPNARSAKNSRIDRWLSLHGDQFEILHPESPEILTSLVKEFADKGERFVAVAGGDGTINYAVRGLVGSNTALAVVPSGTANVFARELRIFDSRLEKAWKAIEARNVCRVDLFMANGVPFVQMAGIGLDARSIELTDTELKRKIGPLAYVVAGFGAMMERQPQLTVTANDGRVFKGMAAIFGNGARYGGPMKVFRAADYGDGLLDMILFRKTPVHLLKDVALAAIKGGFSDSIRGDFDYVRLKGCVVESDREKTPYEIDGDLGGHGRLEITRSPIPLKVYGPCSE